MPHPELLKLYNDAIPDGAARILAMAEEQERHRQSLEQYVVHQDNWRSWGGLIAGFLICVLFLFGALYATVNGYPWVGGAFGTVDLGALAALFVYSNRARERATGEPPNKGKSDNPARH